MLATFDRRASITSAIWRETLIDAAIFREAITITVQDPSPYEWLICSAKYLPRESLWVFRRKLLSDAAQSRPIR
jgi:hypothetical protein